MLSSMGILTPLRSTMKTWVYFLEPPCLGGAVADPEEG